MSRPTVTRRRVTQLFACVAAVTVLAACGGGPDTSSSGSGKALPDSQSDLVTQAKQEGSVVIGAGGHTREQVELLADKFKEKYGIPVTFVRESSGDIAQKVQAQLSADALEFDVISLNNEATLRTWAKDGVLADPKIDNRDDVISTLDTSQGGPYLPFTWGAMGYSYNSAKTKNPPSTWDELASQDAVFAVANPNSSGAALTFVAAMHQIDPNFLASVGQHKALLSDSALALTQLLATGEADYGLPGIEADVATAASGGEPLAMGYPDGKIGVLPSFIARLDKAPHPAAARLLVQFQMSKEFQQAQAGIGSRSVLTDVDAPKGAKNLSEDRLVVIDPEQMSAQKDELLAQFAKNVQS